MSSLPTRSARQGGGAQLERAERPPEDRILDAAVQEFAAKGKAGARMQAIADRAGVAKAQVHYYFRSKDRLHEAVVKRFADQVLSELSRTPIAGSNPEDVIRNVITVFSETLAANPLFPPMMMRQVLEGDVSTFRLIFGEPRFQRLRDDAVAVFAALQQRGGLRPIDPRCFPPLLVGPIVWYFLAQPVLRTIVGDLEPEFFRTLREALTDVFFHGILLPASPEGVD